MKPLFNFLLLFIVTGYLIFVLVRFSNHEEQAQCRTVSIVIADSTKATLITAADVEKMLHKFNLFPIGRPMKSISSSAIEQRLAQDDFIKYVNCIKTPGEHVKIYVAQRLPLLRIMADNGEDYYIDEKGYRMAARGYEADLAVVTGHVDQHFAEKHLVELGKILRDDAFWNAQIEQIHVHPDYNLEVVMRVGEQIVHLGKPNNFARKLRNLRAFYEKVLPNVGWHRYREISVAYENQVIGIK